MPFTIKTIDRYISGYTLIATGMICAILTLMIWLTQSLRLIELVINGGAPVGVFGYLMLLTLPKFLEVALPISSAVAVLFILNKMIMDSELIVIRSLGYSYKDIFRPFLLITAVLMALTFAISGWITPKTNEQMDRMRDIIRSDYSGVLLRHGVFNTLGDDLTLYISKRYSSENLAGIMLHSTREKGAPVTIWAKRGGITKKDDQPFITVYDGTRQQFNERTQSLETLSFEEYSISLSSLDPNSINRFVDEDERTIPSLIQRLHEGDLTDKRARAFWAELHNRFARPFLILSMVSVCFASLFWGSFNRRGQSLKILRAVAFIILIQALYLAAISIAKSSMLGVIAIYAVAILPSIAGLLLIKKLDREKTIRAGM